MSQQRQEEQLQAQQGISVPQVTGTHGEQDIIMDDAPGAEQQAGPSNAGGSDTGSSTVSNASLVQASAAPSSGSAIERLRVRIQEARETLDAIYSQENDEALDESLDAADAIARKISLFESHLSALTSKADKTKHVNLRDIPRFQLMGQTRHYEEYQEFDSLEHFFSTFETVIAASGNDIELVWKQYIPVSMHYTYKTWMHNHLLKCTNWTAAKALFVKHYGIPVNSLDLISKLFKMRMKESDTLQEYTNKFVKCVQEAGFPLESNTLAKFYQCSLLQRNQQMMVNQMLVRRGTDHRWTINEIYECVLPLFLADEQNCVRRAGSDSESGTGAASGSGYTDRKGKRKADGGAESRSKHAKVSTGFFCPKHGGNTANHNAVDCRSSKKNFGSSNKPNRATAAAGPSGRVPPIICNFCNKPRSYGHKCQEFYDWRREREEKKGINVHNVKTVSGSTSASGGADNDATGESSASARKADNTGEDVSMAEIDAYLDNMESEDFSLQCKSNVKNKHESFNPFQLLTPIILESKEGKPVRLIAKVDTGSDATFLNKNVFHNKLLFTSQDIISVEGNLNFLSHSVKRLGKSPAIKIRYLNDISFDHSFELSNFIQDLGDFDVLLGVDTLSRLRIGLTGVAHKFADIGDLTEEEKSDLLESIDFENVNFDTKHSIDPETASIFESQAEENKYMSYIQDAIDENQTIEPGTFCNVPESVITIPIKENVNYYVRQYPIAQHTMPEIQKQLNEWLDAGIVEPCRPNGLFNSPLITVAKKDNDGKPTKTRVCMDVRRINLHMPNNTNQFEIPNIQDIFTRIKQKGTIFSKIDLKNAYFSFKISEASRNVLLFNFKGKTYRWLGCCFGLKPITSVFSSVMNILFGDMPNVEVYVDDLCLVSSSLSEHCELVNEVLRRLTNANLKIGVEKCSWFRSSIYLLGFVVGPHVSKVDMRRLSDLTSWGPCKSMKQVRHLAGVISYLRSYIPNLAKLMAPIDALRNDPDAGSKWTAEHTKRLETIKEILLSGALLTAPNMNKKFYLECDASLYAVGVVLTQRDDQNRTVYVAMLSKSLTKSQQNWPVLRRELYAVLFGLVRLRPLLYGHPEIEVLTDHRALIYIYTCKCPTRVIQNYMEVLSEYPQLQFTHIPGITNLLPDKLSRLYEPLEDSTELAEDGDKKIAKLQKNIMRSKGSKKQFIGSNKQKKHFATKKKRVYNRDKTLNVLAMKIKEHQYESVSYVAPPDNERPQLLRETHEFGHFGAASIVKRLHEEGIHWTGLYNDAKEICQSCMECARHNVVQKGYHELRNVVAYGPFDHVGIDLLGPFTPTNHGNIYILVVYDICTRFIITRALPNKQTDTITRALSAIFCDFGVVQILQSDNGREFHSALMSEITKALGVNQRYSTAFHPRGNGAAESGVKNILNALRKMVNDHIYNWDSVLPGTQLAINTKIRYRTESAPFQLMFARPLNRFVDYNDPKIKENLPKKPMTLQDLRKKAEIMNQVVFPAINQRTQRIVEEAAKRFNKHHKITEFKAGDWVMVKLPHRASKLEAAYDGPFQVVQKERSTYVLKDDMNVLLHRKYVPSELKLVAIDESILEQEVLEVDEIRAHRGPEHNREYLVKWTTFGETENTWETAASFNNPQTIRNYWAKIREYELQEKKRQAHSNGTDPTNKRKRGNNDGKRGSKRPNVEKQ